VYSTCLFCNDSLGANNAIEHFPVGRRLAFDASKGRLWVVCVGCGRWNLSPLEERWEAIEEAERAFRDTTVRVSTDNVGLARLRDGVELIRVGAPRGPSLPRGGTGGTSSRAAAARTSLREPESPRRPSRASRSAQRWRPRSRWARCRSSWCPVSPRSWV
jgi:hypothetical protein